MTTFNIAKPGTKRAIAAEIQIANADKPMGEVSKLIAAAIDVEYGLAEAYYKWLIKNNFAPGTVEKKVRAKALAKVMAPAERKFEHKDNGPVVKSWAHTYVAKHRRIDVPKIKAGTNGKALAKEVAKQLTEGKVKAKKVA